MDDKKDILNSEEELRLKEEMEELARTFQEELDKAKAEEEKLAAEKQEELDILIQEIEEEEQRESEDPADIPEDELCECCGEKRRGTKDNPDSPYCSTCERGLRHYPFDALNIILVIIFIGLSLFACTNFAGRIKTYARVGEADKLAKQAKRESAYTAYSSVVKTLKDNKINAEMVYSRQLQNLFACGNIDEIPDFSTQFTARELKLPHLRKAYNIFKTYDAMSAARTVAYTYVYEYEDIENVKDFPYDEVIKKIDAMIDAPVDRAAIKAQVDDGLVTDNTPYGIRAEKYDNCMLRFIEAYIAAMCEKPEEEQMKFLEQVYREHPEYVWVYGAMLGELYIKQGKDPTDIINRIRASNTEDSVADLLTTIKLRVDGKYKESIELAQKWIDSNDTYIYEFYRQQALCYLMLGENKNAYSAATSAVEFSNTKQNYDTLALVSLVMNNQSSLDEIKELYQKYEMELSDDVKAYEQGTKTVEEILTQGDYDL